MNKAEIIKFADELIVEGERISNDQTNNGITRESPGLNYYPRIVTLFSVLGRHAQPWQFMIQERPRDSVPTTTLKLLGVVRSLREALDRGLLVEVEDIVFAEAFADLLEQARHLQASGYLLAAGVLGRAVLEEHLRKWCGRAGCTPTGRPTINDFNAALYKQSAIHKLEMHSVTAMATAGNHCAHNVAPPLTAGEVEKFLDDVQHFLSNHPLP